MSGWGVARNPLSTLTCQNQETIVTTRIGGIQVKTEPLGILVDGAHCDVIGGTHAGKSGVVTDIKAGSTGHVSITVVQADGVKLKTLAKNVTVRERQRAS
jgi:hypothetical protein